MKVLFDIGHLVRIHLFKCAMRRITPNIQKKILQRRCEFGSLTSPRSNRIIFTRGFAAPILGSIPNSSVLIGGDPGPYRRCLL